MAAEPTLPACPVCGEAEGWKSVTVREMMFGSREPFDYGICGSCGSLVINRIPGDLDRFYPREYWPSGAAEPVLDDPGRLRRWATGVVVDEVVFHRPHRSIEQRLSARILEAPPELASVERFARLARLRSRADRILDVGSGSHPVRLAQLRALAFGSLLAIDPFIERSIRYHGVPVQKTDLDRIRGRFRLITFHHSLEHVPDPFATLRSARRLIHPGGRVQVRTPVMGTELWRRYGADWVEIDAPRHLRVFTLGGFERMADRAGFRVERVIWESTDWDLIASEQYRRDIPLRAATSQLQDPTVRHFDEAELTAFRDEARHLNEIGQAGRAAYWLAPLPANQPPAVHPAADGGPATHP